MIDTELEKQKKILIKVCLYFLTFIAICFYGMTHALAYDFTDWTGATVNKFAFRATLQNDESTTEWITTTSNSPMTWLYRPDLGNLYYMYTSQFGIELGGFTKEIKSGNNSFQFAIGYHEDRLPNGQTSCSAFKQFTNTYNFQYSTDNANTWVDFTSSMLSCSENDGFFVITILVDVPYTINITNLSFSPIHNGLYGNFIATMFTAFNNISADDSSGTIINQNNQIIYQNQELIDNQNKTNEKLDGVIDNQNENTDKIINSNKETQDVIKDQFNSCVVSKNLFDVNDFYTKLSAINSDYVSFNDGDLRVDPRITQNSDFKYMYGQFKENTQYTLSFFGKVYGSSGNPGYFEFFYTDGSSDKFVLKNHTDTRIVYTTQSNKTVSYFSISAFYTYYNGKYSLKNIQLEEGNSATDFLEFGYKHCTNKLDEQNETSKGILGKIKDILSYINPFSENFFAYKLIDLLIDALKFLIVPANFDFINDFKDVLEDKLGFIASVPIQLLDYLLSLKDKLFTPINAISFPSISIFGYYFWDYLTIDITEGLTWISSIKYFTDLGCVIIMVNTLRKWYENFSGGAEK